jgi:hypothetical protein
MHPKSHSDSIDTLRLRADFERMQEDTGRHGRPDLPDTLIRKGKADPLINA